MPKISELTEATSVNDSDVLPIVQSGITKKAARSLLKQLLGQSQALIELDTSTVSTGTWEDLMSISYTKTSEASLLKFSFSASSSNSSNNTQNKFRLVIDDVQYRAVSARGQTVPQTCAYTHVVSGIPAGTKTIKAQWQVSGGTGNIRPVTHSDDESASLLVEEILL